MFKLIKRIINHIHKLREKRLDKEAADIACGNIPKKYINRKS